MTRVLFALVALAVLVSSFGVSAETPQGQQSGLFAHWTFDDVAGTTARDASGNGNDAFITSGRLAKGVDGAGLRFDGRRTDVRCPNVLGPWMPEALTIEAWIRPASPDAPGFPAVVRQEGVCALRFYQNRLGFLLWTNGQPKTLTSRKDDWKADRWYHLAATYDGSEMRLFIDGQEDARSSFSGPVDCFSGDLCLGSSGGLHLFEGVIDEVRVYSRALSESEVLASCQEGQETLRVQQDRSFEPRPIGREAKEFRKPSRAIEMTVPAYLWIDAEDFSDYGGWLLDTQFVHLMGSAYLIAAGIGEPVADATVSVSIPEQGVYRLWVRSKDWLPEHSPGRFQVLVNGTASDKVFGEEPGDSAWGWRSAGEFELGRGETSIALHDLTGYYGRCDALILTTDLDYEPPNGAEELKQERGRLTGLSLEPQEGGRFDVVVVGAGAAGSVAALASARMGAETALIQNRPVLGGNSSIELGVPINGAASAHPNARESGIIEEIGRIKARYRYPKMSEPFRIAAKDEEHLSVFLNNHVYAVGMESEQRIAYVEAVNTLTNEITRYSADVFIDCTGDGWVGYYAGAEYRLGREAAEEFGEDLAPEQPDTITMSGCLMGDLALCYRAESFGKPTAYAPPPWAVKLPPPEEFGRSPRNMSTGEWWMEHPGTIDDLWDAERARDELIRITYGYWDYIKNAWPERARAREYALTFVPITEAKRESRRLVGDYVLTQNDVLSGKVFADRISYGGWPLDVHHPEGIFSGTVGPFHSNNRVPIYTIPFRCLYSVNIDNLLFAGRDMSVTHMALGTVRVQGTLAAMGQAAGMAAALCLEHGVTPRGLHDNHIHALQQTLLKHDQYIPGVVNEDPLDLARAAKVGASSTATCDYFDEAAIRFGEVHPLNMARAVMFPTGADNKLASISLALNSDRAEPFDIALQIRVADSLGDFSSQDNVAVVEATVPPGKSWVEFALEVGSVQAPYVWAVLPKTDGIHWLLTERALLGACRAYAGGASGPWTVVEGQSYAFFTVPSRAVEADYDAASVVNGVTRIIGQSRNMWASDPNQPLPQWIELDFGSPRRFNTVYLTFDTDQNAPYHTVPLVPECVRDYELACFDGTEWKPLASVQANFQRRRVHRFETQTASALRVTVRGTNGSRSARVFEVRVYEE